MMKTAENRSGDDAISFANPVAAQDRLDVITVVANWTAALSK